MEFIDLAKERYSVRGFKADKVPQELTDKIIQAGYVAPTACNRQAIRIIAVNSEDGLERVKRCTDCHFSAPLTFIICSDTDMCWKRPFDGKKSGDVDAAIVTTHMMLQAAELGLGSTWVMFFKADVARAEFNLPENLEPVAFLPVGYPAEDAAPSAQHTQYRDYNEIVSFA